MRPQPDGEKIVAMIRALVLGNVSRCPELEPFQTFLANYERKRRFPKVR